MDGSIQQRFNALEIIIHWEGRLTIGQLEKSLKVSRSTAQKILKEYRQLHPEQLAYDDSLKGYIPTPYFKPNYHSGNIGDYNNWLHQRGESDFLIDLLDSPLRQLQPELIRPILYAIRQKLRIDICYRSMNNPQGAERIISPHSLVFDGLRYHVRAYCEAKSQFRDFVLSRFVYDHKNTLPQVEGPASFQQKDDHAWNQVVEFTIEPDPRFSLPQQALIGYEYQMQQDKTGRWLRPINSRAALLQYLLQRLRLDRYQLEPEAQQIIVSPECQKSLQPWLFKNG